MPRFFIGADQVAGGRATIRGGDAEHLTRSLRARSGHRIVVVDGAGWEHGLLLDDCSPAQVGGAVEWSRPSTGEPALAVHVIQALPKDGMDEVVDSLGALGAASIRPCISERTIPRPDPARRLRRVQRWQTIAREAAQRAGRAAVPRVHPIASLAEACSLLPAGARILACVVTEEMAPLSRVEPAPAIPVVVCIGPEGDFGEADQLILGRAGAEYVHLGPRVLRARHAGSVAVSLLLARAGDLDQPVQLPPA